MAALGSNPHPHGVEKLQGSADLFRIRIGDHRAIVTVDR